MLYCSTRGAEKNVKFTDAMMRGLASDGGLYVPQSLPFVSPSSLLKWRSLSYCELACQIFSLFIDESEIPRQDLSKMVKETYQPSIFGEDIASIRSFSIKRELTSHRAYLLELFHGPTYSFKDYALQLLGRLFEYQLKRTKRKMTVLGATSGDTGSAAIAALAGKENIEVFMLFPGGRVSDIQEKQMTSVLDSNIHVVQVDDGNFDDCQRIVKTSFSDEEFRQQNSLSSVNSINWARVLAQIVYYFFSYFQIISNVDQKAGGTVTFSVPTGNFGDVLAGFYAREMGLPIERFIVATNSNDILPRFFEKGEYSPQQLIATMSPAMDIVYASNFERFLYHMSGRDAEYIDGLYRQLKEKGKFEVREEILQRARGVMSSLSASEEDCRVIIEKYSRVQEEEKRGGLCVCPHTSTAIFALEDFIEKRHLQLQQNHLPTTFVALATAHPAKFFNSTKELYKSGVDIPFGLKKLEEEIETRKLCCVNDCHQVKLLIEKELKLKEEEKEKTKRSFRVKVPCSTSNLGSGYDVFGMALSLYLCVDVQAIFFKDKKKEPLELKITNHGRDADIAPTDSTNLIWRSVLSVFDIQQTQIPFSEVHLSVVNEIPLARGLGSSGAAVVAGALIANELGSFQLSRSDLVELCAKIEGHPDNVSPSLLGGFVSSCKVQGEKNWHICTPIPFSEDLRVVIGIPSISLSTSDSRRVLPREYSSEDVVHNLQRVAILASGALKSLDSLVLQEGLKDLLHQHFRAPLVPGLEECLQLKSFPSSSSSSSCSSNESGFFGTFLSGSGPCVGAFATNNFEEIGMAFVDAFRKKEIECEFKVLEIVSSGASVV